VLRPVLFGLGVGVAWFFWRDQLDTPLALGLNLLATCIVLVLSTRYLRSALPPEARGVRAEFDTKEWWRVAAGFLVISASQVILSQQSDVVVVGTMVTTTAAGQYGAASQLSALVNFGVTAVLFMATPMIAELFAQGNRGQLQRLIVLVARSNAAISIPVWLLLAVAGRFLLSWYGHAFVEAYPVLVILATSQLIVALVGSLAGFILSMTGHQNAAAVIIGVSAALNLGLTIILTPMFGLVGTATATLIGTLVRSIALIVYIKRVLHIDLMPFGLSPRR
jgi:O-antigen/teichoic acid export membrane protein